MAQHGIIVTILSRHWELLFCKSLRRLPDGRQARGWCDDPSAKGKKIRIREGMSDEETLDTTIHEMLHAADWRIDEAFITQFATDAAKALIQLGWRKQELE